MAKRTDAILSVGMLVLVLLALALMSATESTGEFVAWAWERHHNVLSWYIRPLFFLPFCFFAYKRSLSGMTLTLVALATSMFWFPAPERSDPQVLEFLAVEREYLTGDWTTAKVLLASLVLPVAAMSATARRTSTNIPTDRIASVRFAMSFTPFPLPIPAA